MRRYSIVAWLRSLIPPQTSHTYILKATPISASADLLLPVSAALCAVFAELDTNTSILAPVSSYLPGTRGYLLPYPYSAPCPGRQHAAVLNFNPAKTHQTNKRFSQLIENFHIPTKMESSLLANKNLPKVFGFCRDARGRLHNACYRTYTAK